MKFTSILVLLSALVVGSCFQQSLAGSGWIDDNNRLQATSKSGLLFERGQNCGSGFIDSLGTDYSLRYAPITITNDSTIPIHIELAFLEEYTYAVQHGEGKFKVIPLPEDWGRNSTTDSMFDVMFQKLPRYVNRPVLNRTIEAGEQLVLGIGTLVPRPRDVSINLRVPFAHTEGNVHPGCDWQLEEGRSSNNEIALGLKIDINEMCTVIPCGQISYGDRQAE